MDFEGFLSDELTGLGTYAGIVCGDRELAQDVLVESLTKAWKNWERVRQADSPKAYVRRIIVTTFISHQRLRHTRSSSPASHLTAVLDRPVSDGADRRGDADELGIALRTLPPKQRAAVVLRFYEDLDDGDGAVAIGVSTGTYRSLVSRGLAKLRLAVPHRSEAEA